MELDEKESVYKPLNFLTVSTIYYNHKKTFLYPIDLDKELKQVWKMNITVMPTIVWALGTVPKHLEKR